MGKLSMSIEEIKKENEINMGVKQFISDIKVVEKCKILILIMFGMLLKKNINEENSFNGIRPFVKDHEVEKEIEIKIITDKI